MIKSYLSDIINDHKKWKIKLTMWINFTTLHTRSDNIKIMMGSETNDIIEDFCKSVQKYQEKLEESIKGSDFVFGSVDLLYYHLQKISLKRSRSYD